MRSRDDFLAALEAGGDDGPLLVLIADGDGLALRREVLADLAVPLWVIVSLAEPVTVTPLPLTVIVEFVAVSSTLLPAPRVSMSPVPLWLIVSFVVLVTVSVLP